MLCCIAIAFTLSCGRHGGNGQGTAPRAGGYVSLSPAVSEELFLFGVGDHLVGNTTYCKYPRAARSVRKVGNLMQVNFEEIKGMQPSIVFVSEITPPDVVHRLKTLGLRVEVFKTEQNVDDVERNVSRLAKAVGRETRAKKILADMRRNLARVRSRAPRNARTPRVFIEVGAKPLVTAGRDTFLDELVRLAGGSNIAHDAKSGFANFSREEVVRRNPDVILLVTMGEASPSEIDAWGRYKSLRTARSGGICILDAYKVCRPTPTAVVETLRSISQCLSRASDSRTDVK
jgi:ABC-type Fe3+-hydroxamate transport system substrate-binding protein